MPTLWWQTQYHLRRLTLHSLATSTFRAKPICLVISSSTFGRRIAVHLADDGLHPINYMLLCALNYSFQQYYILFRSDCRRMMYATVIKTTVLVVETE